MVSANAMGQAIRNWSGHEVSHSIVGPAVMRPMSPDMRAAMMNVMNTCERSTNFLLIEHFL